LIECFGKFLLFVTLGSCKTGFYVVVAYKFPKQETTDQFMYTLVS